MSQKIKLLEIQHLKKYFPIEQGFFRNVVGHVKAVDDISLDIYQGETLGVVGESGSGKTTFGRCILRAIEPTSGNVIMNLDENNQIDLAKLSKSELRLLRKDIQMIFQDPYSSLSPRMTVMNIIAEPLEAHDILCGKGLQDDVKEIAHTVGLDVRHLNRYPHAFSGGQRQRIGIARSLVTRPQFVVADEPVSALDVSVQAQILNLLLELQEKFQLTYLFIAHDLSVIHHTSDRVAVMYVGKIVELGTTQSLFAQPKHPYTEALLSALPKTVPGEKRDRIVLQGEIANPADPPSGCYFHPRCRYAKDICREEAPSLVETESGQWSACHFADELDLQGVNPANSN